MYVDVHNDMHIRVFICISVYVCIYIYIYIVVCTHIDTTILEVYSRYLIL